MKKLILFTAFILLAWRSQAQDKEQKIHVSGITMQVVTQNYRDIDWDKYRQTLDEVEVSGKFVVEILREGLSKKVQPIKTLITVKGNDPRKTLRRAERWCERAAKAQLSGSGTGARTEVL